MDQCPRDAFVMRAVEDDFDGRSSSVVAVAHSLQREDTGFADGLSRSCSAQSCSRKASKTESSL